VFGLAIAFVVAIVAAGCGSTRTVTETTTVTTTATATETTTATSPTGLGPPAERVQFGHIQSLTRKGDHFEMRFDPAWFLSGETANITAAEDGAVEAGQPVPNDNYILEEGHRLLTYLVPDEAHVTVLTKDGDAAQLGATPITVSELAQIVQGTSSLELFEPSGDGRLDQGQRRHCPHDRPAIPAVVPRSLASTLPRRREIPETHPLLDRLI
jgi:hypothetical protein